MTRFTTQPVDTEPSVGEALKRGREAAGMTLEQVATRTRIQSRFLRALEEGAYKELPEDVYVRSFVKSVAAAVGINAELLVGKLDEELKIAARHGLRGARAMNPPRAAKEGFILTPRKLRAAAAVFLVAAAAAFFAIEIRGALRPPRLTVTSPQNEAVTTSSIAAIIGSTESEVSLYINGVAVAPHSDGTFSETVALEPGVNQITVTAKKRRSQEAKVELRVIYEPPPAVIPSSTPLTAPLRTR